jgi:hypothetical protein
MGADRTLEKVRQDRCQSGAKINRTTLQGWSAKHHWVSRCRDFDNDELRNQSIALRKERLRLRVAREKNAEKYRLILQNRAIKMAQLPLRDNWTEKDLIAMFEASDRFAVISYGGDQPDLPLLSAVKALVEEGAFPPEILEVVLEGIDKLEQTIKQAFAGVEELNNEQEEDI